MLKTKIGSPQKLLSQVVVKVDAIDVSACVRNAHTLLQLNLRSLSSKGDLCERSENIIAQNTGEEISIKIIEEEFILREI